MYLDTLREILFTDSLYCTIKNNNHNKSIVPPHFAGEKTEALKG